MEAPIGQYLIATSFGSTFGSPRIYTEFSPVHGRIWPLQDPISGIRRSSRPLPECRNLVGHWRRLAGTEGGSRVSKHTIGVARQGRRPSPTNITDCKLKQMGFRARILSREEHDLQMLCPSEAAWQLRFRWRRRQVVPFVFVHNKPSSATSLKAYP